MPKSTYAAHSYLNAQYRNVAYTPPATIYVALYTVAPGVGGGGTEVSGGSYVRRSVTFSAPSSQAIANNAEVLFPTATADWGTIVGYAYHDALSGGNFISYAALSSPRAILTGDIFRFPAGMLIVTEG